jgi:hypothetical protein
MLTSSDIMEENRNSLACLKKPVPIYFIYFARSYYNAAHKYSGCIEDDCILKKRDLNAAMPFQDLSRSFPGAFAKSQERHFCVVNTCTMLFVFDFCCSQLYH